GLAVLLVFEPLTLQSLHLFLRSQHQAQTPVTRSGYAQERAGNSPCRYASNARCRKSGYVGSARPLATHASTSTTSPASRALLDGVGMCWRESALTGISSLTFILRP